MKRSGGVTAVGIVLIVAGIFSTIGPLISLAIGPQMVDANIAQMKQGLERLPTGDQAGQISDEKKAKIMTNVDQVGQEIRTMMEAPIIKIATLLKAVLGAFALIGGIGILLLQGWARKLIVVQAGSSIVLGLWELWLSPQRQIAERFVAAMADLVPSAALASLRETMVLGQTVGLGLGLALLLTWNGFIIWFFTRPSTKAQFR